MNPTERPTQPLTPEQVGILMSDIHPSRVKGMSKGGRSFSYVEAYDIRATLIRLFGFGGFDITVDHAEIIRVDETQTRGQNPKPAYAVTAQAIVTLHIPSLGCTYRETAIAMQTQPDFGECADFAIKTAASDALKRCGSNLGTQFGLSLYEGGTKRDIVSVMFDPVQQQALKDWFTENAATREAAQQATQAVVDQATGQQPPQ